MWPYHPELLDKPVPRYTSFPTAAEFAGDVGESDLAEALAATTGDISLYVHIPFCEKICWYCGCNTAAANRRQRLASYLDALHREICLVAKQLPSGTRVRRLAFGGGSPNAIAPVDFVRLFTQLTAEFELQDPVVSIELDPRTLHGEWKQVLLSIGVSRASLGVQTCAPHLQRAIGREQPLCMIDRSVRQLRDAGVTSLNFDLMYGLPGQTKADLERSLEIATKYGTERIALFGYAHVPHMLPRQRRIDASALPGRRQRFEMAQLGHDFLVARGYVPIGFDHFALPGDPMALAAETGQLHRNFQGFTDDSAPVLVGLGASAISSFPSLLVQNEKNSGRYRMLLSQDRLPASLGTHRSQDDFRRASVIEQLLCSHQAQVDPDLLVEAEQLLQPYLEADLCEIAAGVVTILPEGLPYARSIAAAFDPYRQHSPRRFSSAV